MKNQEGTPKSKRISDGAVKAKTGKIWEEWFAVLDAAGAGNMSHTEKARYLQEQQGVPHWWCQMVANTYELDRGLRDKHQMPDGYQISVSKTIGVPVTDLYRSWTDDSARGAWLGGEAITIRKAMPYRSVRITWSDDATNVEVSFNPRVESRTQVVVQHNKLADSEQAEAMKLYWREALNRLQEVVATGSSVGP